MKDQLAKLIAALERDLRKLGSHSDYNFIKPKPNPPATAAEISAYERYLEMPLPPSYRAFLELHNGYEWLAYPGHMLSLRDLAPGGASYRKIQAWKKRFARYGSGEMLDGIVIANLGQPNNWAYLDPNQPAKKGELTVVEWEPEDSAHYGSVLEFLEECHETVKYGLEEAAGGGGNPDEE